MADHRETRVEHLYVKVPNTDKLRKTAAGRHRRLLAEGWREIMRKQEIDHVSVTYERTGHVPLRLRLPRAVADTGRFERRPRGQGFGGRGGPGGRGGGTRGGGRGGPRGGGRGGPRPAAAPQSAPPAPAPQSAPPAPAPPATEPSTGAQPSGA
ncbi:MAG: hypothetical protein ACE14W_00605 [Candidatus Velamenicoccus archaeovorus]